MDVNVNAVNTFPTMEASTAETAPTKFDNHCQSQLAQERLKLDRQMTQLQMENGELRRAAANQARSCRHIELRIFENGMLQVQKLLNISQEPSNRQGGAPKGNDVRDGNTAHSPA